MLRSPPQTQTKPSFEVQECLVNVKLNNVVFLHIPLSVKTPSRNTKIWQAYLCLHYFWPSWNQETLEISQNKLCLTDYSGSITIELEYIRFSCCDPTEYNITHVNTNLLLIFHQITVINKFPRLSDIWTPHFNSTVAAYYIITSYSFYAPSHWVTGLAA